MTGLHLPRSWNVLVLVVGILVAIGSAAQTAYELPETIAGMRPGGEQGMLLVGLYIVARGLTEVLVDVQRVGELAEHQHVNRLLGWRRIIAGPYAEALVGTLLVVAAVGEAFDIGVEDAGQVHVWHWGLGLMGLSLVAQAGHHLVEGLEKLEHARLPHWLQHVCHFICQPVVQIGLAIAIFGLAVGEVFAPLPPEVAERNEPMLGQHGMAAMAMLKLARACLTMNKAVDLVQGAAEHEGQPVEVG